MPSSTLAAIFFAALALTTGLPSQDAFDIASQEVSSLLQQGNGESACADLAKSLVDEVTSSVEVSNKILEALDNGSDCPNKGQDAVTTAQQNKDAYDKAATDAASAASAADNAFVDFGSYSLSSLTTGQCTQFWEDKAYMAAKQAATQAATAKTEADATAGAMDQALTIAEEEAAKQVEACQCAARAAYNTALAATTAKAADDVAAFTKGKLMQCVLAGTAEEDCVVGDVPTPKAVTLADGVPAEACASPTTFS